jgi:hypothetical protein
MKLVNILAVALFGGLFTAGCTVTDDETGDAGETGTVTDTGTPADTKPAETTPTDTGTDTGFANCQACITAKCPTEGTACTDTNCKDGIACLNGCTAAGGDVLTCKNKCVTDHAASSTKSSQFDDLVTCLNSNCKAICLQ